MAKDSASIGLDGTRYKSLTDRLDAEASTGGGGGWTVASVNSDLDIDLGASLDGGFSTVVISPSSPPSGWVVLPPNDRSSFVLAFVGAHPSGFSYVSDDKVVTAVDIFRAGEFVVEDVRFFTMVPISGNAGWTAFPIFSAADLPEATYALQVTVVDGEVPSWFLGV